MSSQVYCAASTAAVADLNAGDGMSGTPLSAAARSAGRLCGDPTGSCALQDDGESTAALTSGRLSTKLTMSWRSDDSSRSWSPGRDLVAQYAARTTPRFRRSRQPGVEHALDSANPIGARA